MTRWLIVVFLASLLLGCGGGTPTPNPGLVRRSKDIIAEDQLGRRAVTWGDVVVTHLESSTSTPLKTDTGAAGVDEWPIKGDARRSLMFDVRIPAVRFRVRDRDGNLLLELKQGDPPARVNLAKTEYRVELANTGAETRMVRVALKEDDDTFAVEKAVAPWPMYHGNAQHTGRSPHSGPKGIQKWTAYLYGPIHSSPAIGPDGTIYVGSDAGRLFAIDPATGNIKWSFATGSAMVSSPAVGEDGTIYFHGAGGAFYALAPDGSVRWKNPAVAVGVPSWTPTIGSDGTIYSFGPSQEYPNFADLLAMRSDGTVIWRAPAAPGFVADRYAAPSIAPSGRVVYSAGNGIVTLLAPNGAVLVQNLPGMQNDQSTAAIAPDGSFCYGSSAWQINGFDPSGNQEWSIETAGEIYASPALAADGTFVVADAAPSFQGYNPELFAVQPNGTLKWRVTLPGPGTSAIIDAEGRIYLGWSVSTPTPDGSLLVLNADGSQAWQDNTTGPIDSTPALDASGTLYVGTLNGFLYAYE